MALCCASVISVVNLFTLLAGITILLKKGLQCYDRPVKCETHSGVRSHDEMICLILERAVRISPDFDLSSVRNVQAGVPMTI